MLLVARVLLENVGLLEIGLLGGFVLAKVFFVVNVDPLLLVVVLEVLEFVLKLDLYEEVELFEKLNPPGLGVFVIVDLEFILTGGN